MKLARANKLHYGDLNSSNNSASTHTKFKYEKLQQPEEKYMNAKSPMTDYSSQSTVIHSHALGPLSLSRNVVYLAITLEQIYVSLPLGEASF